MWYTCIVPLAPPYSAHHTTLESNMNITDLTKKHKNVDFSSFDDANNRKATKLNVRWVRSDVSFHIRFATELFYHTDDIEIVDNILSNIKFLKNWTKIVLKKLKSTKQIEAKSLGEFYIIDREIKVSIRSIGFEVAVELNKKFNGSLRVRQLHQSVYHYTETTIDDLNKTIIESVSKHADFAKKTYEDSIKILSSMQKT
jgi:hypothetical protein